MTYRLVVLPLDDRPVTYDLPARVGAIAGASVSLPPRGLLGNLERPADRAALGAWLTDAAADADALVVALDTLAYGGLIPSRRSPDDLAALLAALEPLKQLKTRRPGLPIHAFSVTMRLSNSDVNEEEKPYWDRHGKAIYRWSYHQHRFKATNDEADRLAAAEARRSVPAEILEDYLETRERNFALNQAMVKWAGAGFFATLLLTQDDTSEFGLNVEEQQHLAQMVATTHVGDRVLIHPGADEVASVLVARALNALAGAQPTVAVSWHPLEGKRVVAMYEDRPLWKTLRGQIQAAGGREVGDPALADARIVVNAPGEGQGDLALRYELDRPERPHPRNFEPLLLDLEAALASGKPTAFADVAYANGADPRLTPELVGRVDLFALAAYAAWNTAGNSFGTLVAALFAGLLQTADAQARRRFLTERLADDWLYQSVIRPGLQPRLAAGEALPALRDALEAELNTRWEAAFPGQRAPFTPSFPWKRLFEADPGLLARS